ncbi:MFS transporter [Limnohabitans sp. WS1]|nr:MFS transporter [Limnohabitans sp. WS1]
MTTPLNMSLPRLTIWQIVQMNIGFLGLQFSFGLQQSSMGPIYSYLGANEAALPLLSLAGPVTGLLVQPIVGAMSDRCTSRFGRRTPFFLIGAIVCSLCLLAMPYSQALWMAASLLWILDAANNTAMEPYRAYVGDRLPKDQHAHGFIIQSAFTGLAQTLAYLTPSLLVWSGMNKDAVGDNHIPQITLFAFMIGALISVTTMFWSIWRVPELPLSSEQKAKLASKKQGLSATLIEIWDAIREMPTPMRQMAWMKLFQWMAMGWYWQYVAYSIARSLFGTNDPTSTGFRDAVLVNGEVGAFYNLVSFITALLMVRYTQRFGAPKVHAVCLTLSGLGMWFLPQIDSYAWLFLPAVGVGLGWASIMGNPYVMLARSVPPERTGVYMGIFNMFIVIPLLIGAGLMSLMYDGVFGGDPRNVLMTAGVLMICAAVATLRVKVPD